MSGDPILAALARLEAAQAELRSAMMARLDRLDAALVELRREMRALRR